MRNQNQGKPVEDKQFGLTEQDTTKQYASSPVTKRVVLLNGGAIVDKPRVYVDFATTNGSGEATFYLTDDATNGGVDRFDSYFEITARVNDANALYAVGWSRVGHTVTATVNAVTIVAGALDFSPASGVNVGLEVWGSAP